MPTAPAYTDEIRRQAVDLMATENLSVAEAARRLAADASALRNWVKKYRPAQATTAPPPPSVEHELRRRREENRQLKMEQDVLGRSD